MEESMTLLMALLMDILIFFFLYLIVTSSLNLQYGYCGIPNLGLAFSVIGGAIIAAILPGNLAMALFSVGPNLSFVDDNEKVLALLTPRLESDPWTAMLIFIVCMMATLAFGAFLGLISSLPATRLRTDYLAVSLISMGEALRVIFYYCRPIARSSLGILIPDLFAWLGSYSTIGKLIVVGLVSALVFLVIVRICNSPFGRLLKAVRENDITAQGVGKDIVRTRVLVLTLGSGFAALAGFLDSIFYAVVIPDAYTRVDWSFWPWLMLLLGGMGNNKGAFLGALIIVTVRRIIFMSKHFLAPYVFFDVAWLDPMLVGVFILMMMAFRPGGVLSEKSPTYKGLRGT